MSHRNDILCAGYDRPKDEVESEQEDRFGKAIEPGEKLPECKLSRRTV